MGAQWMREHGRNTFIAALVVLSLLIILARSQGYGTPSTHVQNGDYSTNVHLLRPPTATSPAQVTVFLNGTSSITWTPNTLVVPSGATVTFVIGTIGQTLHNFTLDSISNDTGLSTSMTADQLYGYFNAHHPLVSTPTLNTSGKPFVTRPVQMLSQAVFEFVCEYPGHFQSGMYGFLYVGINPVNHQAPSQLSILEIDSIVITVVAMLLVAAIFLTREKRHPPTHERTGTAEHHD